MHMLKRHRERQKQRDRERQHAFNLHYAKRLLVYHRNAVASYQLPVTPQGQNCPQTMQAAREGTTQRKKKFNVSSRMARTVLENSAELCLVQFSKKITFY